ncbi:FAD dependent oxidoreductase [Geobacter metallireducens RCH3]|uniref:FAD-dependent oxidoreductase, putative n=1 Tax=Geobacter metallireducens (strain ATCC 53774 / DSM 7210 / GS-15) TaxID=269799 RepID=Q39S80_GEOMG|nr:FAD-dependent oxidoreductase [Geobacter metallireducens]ABB32894.1 FAD-dependent oxidoreductase, putative [Geobacter metallireducens GS-15]EHP88972.1 FAD dependent oxidoreductase [Geobacter metallireducens RCH3]
MPILIRNIVLAPGEGDDVLGTRVAERFGVPERDIQSLHLVRKSIDARRKPRVIIVCTVQCRLLDEAGFLVRHGHDPDVKAVKEEPQPVFPRLAGGGRIVIVGMGPAGLFAALRLAEYGLAPTILERGRPVEERTRDVQAFWSLGQLDTESNVQFGEGGAGTFSDGKLTTRVNDSRIGYVLQKFVDFGASPEILHLAKPHVGTDQLRRVVAGIRQGLLAAGCDIRFRSRVTDIVSREGRVGTVIVNGTDEIAADALVLAPGHSARDTYEMLARRGVHLQAKPFAMGVRVEHPQELINGIQYGKGHHPALPPADYALAHNDRRTGRSAYSFCMCPGGVVVAGSSEEGGVVTNGMSAHLRNTPFANSALVVTVGPDDFGSSSPLAGVEFQRHWERRAFEAGGGGYRAPAQNLLSFLGMKGGKGVSSSYRPRVTETDLSRVLPAAVTGTLREALPTFDRRMRGFVTAEATLTGVETRTSAPVRIVRGEDCQSVSLQGLYPTGEGAGYAGGIMSAALDGIRVADIIAGKMTAETRSAI